MALATAQFGVPPAGARSGGPVYRDPPSYKGSRTPKTKSVVIPAPPPVVLSAAGTFPDVFVDEAGTAHIVWNENRGDSADVVVYCRLKRGASACDSRSELVWNKSYDSGDDPAFNSGGPPRIVEVGDQLVVLQNRYPTFAQRPDQSAGSSNDLEWTSSDGGTTWAGPAIVGDRFLGELAVFGPADDPAILDFGIDPYCAQSDTGINAGACLEAFKSGRYSGDAAQLGTVNDANYTPSIAIDGGLPVTGLSDLNDNTYIRRWSGSGSVTDAATWSPPAVLPKTDEPVLAGGAKGLYMMYRGSDSPAPYLVRKLTAGPNGASTAGTPVRVGDPDGGGQFDELFEDPAGGLFAAWESHGSEKPKRAPGLLLRTSTSGTSFAPAQTLVPGNDIGQEQLGATNDGGGFAVLNRTGFVNSEGEIDAAGFGNQAATGKPGIADIPGGAGVVPSGANCDQLKFGSFQIDSAEGCFLRGTGANKGVFVTGGEINLWGLRIVPDPGCRLIIDPKSLQFDTSPSCGARVIVTAPLVGDITLWHGEIHRDLSKVVPGTDLFEFPAGAFKANILGFDVGADINIRLENDGVHIPVDLQLPAAFGGFSGHAELVADRETGLHINSLHIHIGPVPLGVLVINNLDLDYASDGDVWTGSGSITVPAGGTLDGTAKFTHGAFNGAQFSYTPAVPITVGPFVYLLSIGGGFFTDPTHIIATASLGAGAAAAGEAPVKVDGQFDMIFPANGPGEFKLSGSVSLFFIHVGDAYLRFDTDGYAAFGGNAGFDLGPLSVKASTDGFVDANTGDFGADVKGSVDLCVDIKLTNVCAGASADTAVSNKGFAACASFSLLGEDISGGLEYPWADFDPAAFINPFVAAESIITHLEFPCSTASYHVPPPRARRRQAGGGIAVDVKGGLPTETILVQGNGAAPKVSVSGPGGSFTSEAPGAAGLVVVPRGINAAYVVLKKPKAGAWTITPESGSAAITKIMTGDGYVPAKVRAKLAGHGRRRTIAYRISNGGNGQSVQFLETGAFGTHVLGRVTKPRGVLHFAPADAKGGVRTVFALVAHDGISGGRAKVGTYHAPGPIRPGAVRKLKARRHGTTVTVTWRSASRAARYAVRLSGNHVRLGRLVPAKTHRLSFPAVRRGGKIVVTVTALSKKLRTGPVRSARAR